MGRIARRTLPCILVLAAFIQACSIACHAADEAASFEIKRIALQGNSIFTAERLQKILTSYTGPGKTAKDVEKARDAVEKFYHDAGYPAVMVNIPEQTLTDGVVRLEVIESRIGTVKVTGNRYFTREKIIRDTPSLSPGSFLYLPEVERDLGRLNRNPDFKAEPMIAPGKEPGTIDVGLKIQDSLPLHGSLELNNRATLNTSRLRLLGMLRYDNFWQREHSIALQYQTSPLNVNDVAVVGGSYVLNAPWDRDHQIAFYGIWSDSDTAFGEGFKMIGKGETFGLRYIIPLKPYRMYAHNIMAGLDYKRIRDEMGFADAGGQTTSTPVTYMPLSFAYSASLPDEWGGTTLFSAGLNLSFRGVVSDQREFEAKRYKGMADYAYFTAGIQRAQKLPGGMGLFVKVDGQTADQPLISNEQYAAGGMENVRGYMDNEGAGDDAVHAMVELTFPNPLGKLGLLKRLQADPYIFYDVASLRTKEALPGQDASARLQGAGVGIRGSVTKYFEYEVDWATALGETDHTPRGYNRFYFKVKVLF